MSNAVLPTVKNRIESLDFLRGIAILGILLANIFAFGWLGLSQEVFGHKLLPGHDHVIEAIRNTFVSGKFRSLLSLLFGAGMYLQFRKYQSVPGAWPGSYAKRTLLLMVLGFIHAIFIWYGDILFAYSVVALIAMLFARLSDRAIFWTAISLLVLSLLMGIGSVGQSAIPEGADSSMDAIFGWATHDAETKTFATGTYFDQLKFRAFHFLVLLVGMIQINLSLGSQFLFGFLLAKKGVFVRPSAHPRLVRILSGIGVFGLLANALMAFWPVMNPGGADFTNVIELGGNAFLAIGYAIWGAILVEKGRAKGLVNLVSPVGKMALTSYLMQSVICTTLFYSWGGGLFGKLNYLQILAVCPAVWCVNIIFAHFWLKKYPMGPVEWLWRSATLGRNANVAVTQAAVDGAEPPKLFEPTANPQFRDWN